MEKVNDGHIMLLDELVMGGKTIGLISQEGIDWGGDKPTYNKLFAAQRRGGPVKKVLATPGTNMFTFQMIQLLAENCVALAGGTATGDKWDAPSDVVTIEGPAQIKTGTGQLIDIKMLSLNAVVRGKLGNSGNLYLDCEAEVITPTDGTSPFSIGMAEPYVSVDNSTVQFVKAGGTKVVRMSSSGALTVSAAPAGFTIVQDGNFLVITAAANDGSTVKTGTITLTLATDSAKTATIELTQAK